MIPEILVHPLSIQKDKGKKVQMGMERLKIKQEKMSEDLRLKVDTKTSFWNNSSQDECSL